MAIRYQSQIQAAIGDALDGVFIYVCTQPNTIDPDNPAIPPSPLAVLYTDSSGSVPASNPVTSDGNGNYFFYTNETIVTLVIYDVLQRIEPIVLPDISITSGGGGGGGTVTSVGLTMPAEFSVAGSPVINAGTLAVTKANQNAGTIYAGPATGPAAAPTFQDAIAWLTAIGFGSGSVTSVALAFASLNALFTGSITGSPITSSGTLGINLALANQLANKFLAGPASGGIGPVTARQIVAADIFGLVATAFSATPTFDASAFALPTFTMTLSGNVTSSTVSNPTNGQEIDFVITQDGTGSRGFSWPVDFKSAMVVDGTPNSINIQSFKRTADGFWRAMNTGITMLS